MNRQQTTKKNLKGESKESLSDFFAPEEKEQAAFTIAIGANANANSSSRAAAYPPEGFTGSPAGAPTLAELKFVVKFTPVGNSGKAKTLTAAGGGAK
jgi:hypothetical protein